MKSKSKYHHGDLRATLLQLAEAQIALAGVEKLSLRALARQAGVSATAPFRHFSDKQALLGALAIDGFNELAQSINEESKASTSLEMRFVGIGVSYIAFAQNFPVHYQLMFGSVLGDFAQQPELQEAAARTYGILDELLMDMRRQEDLAMPIEALGGLVWSTVHGMASLLINIPPANAQTDVAPRQAVRTLAEDPRGPLKALYRGIVAG